MAAKCVSTNAGLWELFGLRTGLRARLCPALPPHRGLSPAYLGWASRERHRLQQLPDGPPRGVRAARQGLLLSSPPPGFLNDCPRRSCVALHTVVYRPQCRPPLCKRAYAEITAGADAGDWAQHKPGNVIAAAEVGKEMSCNPRHRCLPSRAWWFPSALLQKL